MCRGRAKSLSLDLYGQWKCMELDGKWRYTSPTHVVLAFAQAIRELEAGGGIAARHRRYAENNRLLICGLKELGFRPYVGEEHRHLSGQGDGCRDLPGGQYRRNLSPGYGKIVRDFG